MLYPIQEGSDSVFVTLRGTTTFPVQEEVQIRLQSLPGGSATGCIAITAVRACGSLF